MERHLQTVLIAIVVALILWVGNKLVAVSDQQIALKAALEATSASISTLNGDIAAMRTQMREFYLRSEAERTNTDIYNWLRRNDERLIKLEREVGK